MSENSGVRDFKDGRHWVYVTRDQLDFNAAIRFVEDPRAGAVVFFSGNVRNHSEGRDGVTSLSYETYEEVIVNELSKVAFSTSFDFDGIVKVAIGHRLGPCEVGESTVLIAVSSEHREAAFLAGKFAIDTLKRSVPIWKKETWSEGSDWSKNSSVIEQL